MTSIGIDYSMTCPAACHYDDAAGTYRFWYAHETKFIKADNLDYQGISKSGTVTQRASRLASGLLDWLFLRGTAKVYIEDYAFAATGRVFHIGENTGILKHFLETRSIAYEPVPPTVIKKFATGKGNADKIKMTMAFLDDYPEAESWAMKFFPRSPDGRLEPCKWAKSPLADLADAYWIANYAVAQS